MRTTVYGEGGHTCTYALQTVQKGQLYHIQFSFLNKHTRTLAEHTQTHRIVYCHLRSKRTLKRSTRQKEMETVSVAAK